MTTIHNHHQHEHRPTATTGHLKNLCEVESLAIPENTNDGGARSYKNLRPSINAVKQKQHPADLATEIGSSLVAEVRRLRGQVKELEATRASEQQEHEHAVRQRHQLEKQQDGMKDEIWNLELAKQELEEQLEKANGKLARMAAEYARLEKQLEQVHNKSAEQCRTEQETNNAARQLEQHRLTLVKELRALKKENAHLQQQLQTATTEIGLWKNKVALLTNNNQSTPSPSPPPKSALPPDPQSSLHTDEPTTTTPPGSPPQHHTTTTVQHHLEKETLQQSLAHAHQLISSLRATLHKEKLDGIETKKLLAENQETIEELRRDSLTNQSHRRKQHRRYRARQAKRNSMVQVAESGESDDNTSQHTADEEESDNGSGTGVVEGGGVPVQNSLFSELQNSGINSDSNTATHHNSSSSTISNGETQTDAVDKIDVETQTEQATNVVTVDAAVQCSINNDDEQSLSLGAIQQQQQQQQRTAQRQSYFEPFKRAFQETSTTLRSRKQRPSTVNGVRPVSTISTPPTLSSAKRQSKKQQQQQSSPHVEFAPTTIGSLGKSKLLEYASKYNNSLTRSPSRASNTVTSPPPTPTPSFSIATPRGNISTMKNRNSAKDPVFPVTSVSDSLTSKRRRPSRTTANRLDTLSEAAVAATGMRNGGNDEEGVCIDPVIVEAVTQTMIGTWMWKHTRHYVMGKNGISHRKGHMRFVWIHPYTRTLYWSAKPPGIDHDETKSKRAFIKDVWSVPCTENPCSSVSSNLLIRTSARDLMLHAETMAQHHQWITALCYLLGRPGLNVEESDHNVVARTSSLNSSSCGVSILSGSNTLSTYSTAFLNSSIFQGSSNTSSPQDSTVSDDDDEDDDEDFINIRQCCNGKHDVSTLARK